MVIIKVNRHGKRNRHRQQHQAYRDRKETLSITGYTSYSEYLQSEQWQKLRAEKLARFPNCLLCDRKANQVHHLAYTFDVLLGFSPHLLVSLCGECHEGIEFDAKAVKRSLEEANAELKRRAADRELYGWLKAISRAFHKSRRLLEREQSSRLKREHAAKRKRIHDRKDKKEKRKLTWLCALCKKQEIRSGITCQQCRELAYT